jgi:hypothetical protein
MLNRARLFFLLAVLALLGQTAMPALHATQAAGGGRSAALEICSADGKYTSVDLPLGKPAPGGHASHDCSCCVGGGAAPLQAAAVLPRLVHSTVEQASALPVSLSRQVWRDARPRAPPAALV